MIIEYKTALKEGVVKYAKMLEHNPNSIVAQKQIAKYQYKLFRLMQGYEFKR